MYLALKVSITIIHFLTTHKTFACNIVICNLVNICKYISLCFQVILIFGISGSLRSSEICNLKVQDVEDLQNRYVVTIQSSKNDLNSDTITASRQLLIGPLFYNIVKQYIQPKPSEKFANNFFIRY